MELLADRGRLVSVEELNTTKLLAHARKQAGQRKLDDMLVVDVDSSSLREGVLDEVLPFVENEVLRQLLLADRAKGRRDHAEPNLVSRTWAAASRAIRCALRKRPGRARGRDIELGHRWMDAISVDYACLFPTRCCPSADIRRSRSRTSCTWAYNRWVTEKVLPESDERLYSMLRLPLSDPDEALRQVENSATVSTSRACWSSRPAPCRCTTIPT